MTLTPPLRTLALATLTLALAPVGSAPAQDRRAPERTYEFTDEVVPGDRVQPLGEGVILRLPGDRRSLVRYRVHFVPQLVESVRDL
ncbi:MAG: hypothetical protein ACFCGT_03435 [Sandaracinaceae bacterium]